MKKPLEKLAVECDGKLLKPISGRESSILAIIAQNRNYYLVNPKYAGHLLEALSTPNAYQIARVMLGYSYNGKFKKIIYTAADSFIEWAKSLSK
ncbi:MAG: hypothetical protein V1914_01500 [archaeon]